ncbi:MAG: hypothetical protein M0Z73_06645 [Betaproteobacteria bacterium]|nr:hypothetical protein [Betaproteobacteria bacterium]
MRLLSLFLSALCLWVTAAHAGVPDFQRFPATGQRLLLWVASERGRSDPELAAARQLAAQGVEVWSLDPANAYFLPQVPSSMDALPLQDMSAWLRAADASGKRVVVFAVGRAAVPVLRAAALLGRERRSRLCVMLMHPNLYTTAEPLSAPAYLDLGDLSGLRVRVLQPRRSAATPWLSSLTDHLGRLGADASAAILENLREGYWAREAPTDFETAERDRMDAMLLHQLDLWGCE